jgi:hypothetical protein
MAVTDSAGVTPAVLGTEVPSAHVSLGKGDVAFLTLLVGGEKFQPRSVDSHHFLKLQHRSLVQSLQERLDFAVRLHSNDWCSLDCDTCNSECLVLQFVEDLNVVVCGGGEDLCAVLEDWPHVSSVREHELVETCSQGDSCCTLHQPDPLFSLRGRFLEMCFAGELPVQCDSKVD